MTSIQLKENNDRTVQWSTITYQIKKKVGWLGEHKLFLQVLLNNRYLGEEEAIDFFKKIFGEERDAGDMVDEIERMNEAISSIHHKIEKVRCEVTGRPVYIYYPKHTKNFGSIDKLFTPAQKNLVGLIIQEIVDSETGIISYAAVQRLALKVLSTGVKQLDSGELVNKLLDNHLLERTDNDMLHLSALGVKQLEPYLRETFDDIQECQLCQSIIIHGISCQSCHCRVHKHCLLQYTSRRRSQNSKCPGCDEDFFLSQKES